MMHGPPYPALYKLTSEWLPERERNKLSVIFAGMSPYFNFALVK